MEFKMIFLKVILIALNFHVGNAFPVPKHTCNVENVFFDNLKKAISDVIKGREEISLETSGNFGDCHEDLVEIVSTLRQILAETTLVRKESDTIEDLEDLKEVFQEKMADFVREQDIFQRDFNANQLKTKGKLYDKVHQLRVEIRDLEEEIRKTEVEYLHTAFEFIKTSLESGFDGENALNYAKTIPEEKFLDLIIYVQENQETVKKALNLLAKANVSKDIMPAIRESIKLNFGKITKITYEAVFQWASNRTRQN
uniref:Uncharacterized protein n=1 Tax=Culex quinquefasciatus TaxID=7176 RepID=A0A1S4KKL4_CULQU